MAKQSRLDLEGQEYRKNEIPGKNRYDSLTNPYDANHANVVKYMREELGMSHGDSAEAVVCLDGARPTPAFVWMRNKAGTPMNVSMDAPEEDLKYPETTRTPTHPQFRTLFGTDIPYDEVR